MPMLGHERQMAVIHSDDDNMVYCLKSARRWKSKVWTSCGINENFPVVSDRTSAAAHSIKLDCRINSMVIISKARDAALKKHRCM